MTNEKLKPVLKSRKHSNLNEIAKLVAERESGKVEVSIAQIKEVMRILGDLNHENNDVFTAMSANAAKRAIK